MSRPITDAQLDYICKLQVRMRLGWVVDNLCRSRFGKTRPLDLTVGEASAIIRELRAIARRRDPIVPRI